MTAIRTYTQGLNESLAPWLTPDYQNLLAARGAMFEQVFSIVSDQGTPDGPLIAITSGGLSTTGMTDHIPVQALLETVAANTLLMTVDTSGYQWQLWMTSGNAARNAGTVPVVPQVASFAYPSGTQVSLGYQAGWSTLLDPDVCPTQFLPLCAVFNGTVVAPGTSDVEARAIIKAESGWKRGLPSAVVTAIEAAQVTPDATRYALIERYGAKGPDPYRFLIRVDPSSLRTPGDATQLDANVEAVRPAGVRFDVVLSASPLVVEWTRQFSAVTVNIDSVQTLAQVT